jgi:SSS family solute:Na+ symporter
MNLTFADLAMIGLYFAAMAVLAYLTRRNKTFAEFAVGRHAVPAVMIFASLATTIVGPGFSIGFTAKGWATGYAFYFMVLAYAVQVVVVGLFLAPRLNQYRDCRSLGDVMRTKYGRFTQLLTGIVSVGLCIGFTAVMGKVGGSALHAVTGWPLPVCLVAVTGTTALITFSGGVRATIATEGMQFALKCLVVSLLVGLVALSGHESMAAIAQRGAALTQSGFAGMNAWQIAGVVISFGLGEALIPPYVNRALVAKSAAGSRAGFVAAGIFCVVWLAMIAFLGIAAHGVLPAGTSGDDAFILTAQAVLPTGLFGLLLAAVVAIVMSSQESVLNSSAVAFVRDIVSVVHEPSERMTLLLAKGSTLVFAVIAIYAAQFAPSIIDGLLILYAIWAPTILVPLVAGLYLKNTRPLAGWLSILSGGGASLAWQMALHEPGGVPSILVGVVAALAAYAVGHLAGRPIRAQLQGQSA